MEETFSNKGLIAKCGEFVCVRLDPRLNGEEAHCYTVSGVPTIVFSDRGGNYIDRVEGFINPDQLEEKMNGVIQNAFSLKELERMVKDDPSNITWKAILAERYLRANAVNKSLYLFEEILKKDPENKLGYTDKALFTTGFIYGKMGDYNKSVNMLEILIKKYPEYAKIQKARYCLSLGLVALGKVDEAKSELDFIITEYPATDVSRAAENVRKKLSQTLEDNRKKQ